MTTITREHLELAALAAGMIPREFAGNADYMAGVLDRWRPHTDIAEAARLADKYRMYVDSRGTAVQARLYPGDKWTRVEREGNPHAWCEAVTLCAAEIGRQIMDGERLAQDRDMVTAATPPHPGD